MTTSHGAAPAEIMRSALAGAGTQASPRIAVATSSGTTIASPGG